MDPSFLCFRLDESKVLIERLINEKAVISDLIHKDVYNQPLFLFTHSFEVKDIHKP